MAADGDGITATRSAVGCVSVSYMLWNGGGGKYEETGIIEHAQNTHDARIERPHGIHKRLPENAPAPRRAES